MYTPLHFYYLGDISNGPNPHNAIGEIKQYKEVHLNLHTKWKYPLHLCAAALFFKCLFINENASLVLQVVRVTKCSFKISE